MKRSFLVYPVLLFLLGACAALKKGDTGADAFANYSEDLNKTLIKFPDLAEASQRSDAEEVALGQESIDADLAQSLENFIDNNRSERYWNGFTVLVYSGVDRDLAFKTRDKLYTEFEDMKVDMQYQQPRYLVKVGKFINRIEAQAYFHQLIEEFPASRIIQDRFQREGYVTPEPVQDGDR